MAVFTFCPERNVPETIAREAAASAVSLNGWQFTARPTTPYQKKFKVMLHGLRWYLNSSTGLYDSTTNPTFNARALELFYQEHEMWKPFTFPHQHLGNVECRFHTPLNIPAAKPNSGGFIDAFEMMLIAHNPGY